MQEEDNMKRWMMLKFRMVTKTLKSAYNVLAPENT